MKRKTKKNKNNQEYYDDEYYEQQKERNNLKEEEKVLEEESTALPKIAGLPLKVIYCRYCKVPIEMCEFISKNIKFC